jgi:hypothetical protein
MPYLKATILIAFGQALIYGGLCFLSGHLLPSLLKELYQHIPGWLRIVVFTLVSAIPANILISWGFRDTGATYAGVMNASCAVLAAVVTAILVDGATIRLNSALAFIIMIVSAAYGIAALRESIPQ